MSHGSQNLWERREEVDGEGGPIKDGEAHAWSLEETGESLHC